MSLAYPWISTAELEQHLGAALDPDVADRLVMTATQIVAPHVSLVDDEGDPLANVPEAVKTAVLYIAAEIYKAGVGIDGTLQVNWVEQVPSSINSVIIRRYGPLLAPWLASTGVVG